MFSILPYKTLLTPSEQIRQLQRCAGSDFQRVLIQGPEDEPLYVLKNNETVKWLIWINTKILYALPNITYDKEKTISVRIRIATNMLNKLEQSKLLPKEVCLMYHKRLVENVKKVIGEIYVETLPF